MAHHLYMCPHCMLTSSKCHACTATCCQNVHCRAEKERHLFRARPLPQSHNQPPAVQPGATVASRRGSSASSDTTAANGTTSSTAATALGLAGVPKELLAALAQDPEGAALLEQIRAFPDVDVGAILAAASDDGSDSLSTCSSEEFQYASATAATATDGDAPLTNGQSDGHLNGHSSATAVLPALQLPESSTSATAARAAAGTTTGVHSSDTVTAAVPVHDNSRHSNSSNHYAIPHTAGALSSSWRGSASSAVAPPRRRRSSSGSVMETARAGTPRSASALGAMLEAGCGMLDRQQEWDRQRKRRLSEVTAALREQVSLHVVCTARLQPATCISDRVAVCNTVSGGGGSSGNSSNS
jgi:hypothetical protein